ncbi:type IV toxin-antitoxin system AbiEi family antitoxin domain-containing protein [Symbioplanes lichenis]|uniref:type IV toxin-antitoxin system AbiEi family antitoxin domain-containing protein n=1 Tax=Symbioplanes lichenis TaxID=1629072 RepID=UPI00273A3FA8|nr:type IV toxin-antitoxin system AbiEi family antitoxin domain-containing protein [Actinoplanes lichenis]
MIERWTDVLAIAEEQWGLVTRHQVDATGVAGTTLTRHVQRGSIERVAHGVYRIRGGGEPDHLELRAAWLQLEPRIPAWDRIPADGVVSHRSAATLYGIGHLPADKHEFLLPSRRQTRRNDVRLHRGNLENDWTTLRGLPVTRPRRTSADLLADHEDPGAVAQLIADALRAGYDEPAAIAAAIAPHAAAHGLRRGDGAGLLHWLLDLSGDPDRQRWLAEPGLDKTPNREAVE